MRMRWGIPGCGVKVDAKVLAGGQLSTGSVTVNERKLERRKERRGGDSFERQIGFLTMLEKDEGVSPHKTHLPALFTGHHWAY